MEDIIAPVEDLRFDIEIALGMQLGAKPLPFAGMDKSGAGICIFHHKAVCDLGQQCPFRHVREDRNIVCKHWLRGLCKKGDDCEFLHEYDMTKMPECYFFQRFGECGNKECPFLHIDPESKRRDCLWYDRGFCKNGPDCKNRHIRKVMCLSYLAGFCPKGSKCKHTHPKFEFPNDLPRRTVPVCHHCGEMGHIVFRCFKITEEEKQKYQDIQDEKRAAREQREQRYNSYKRSSDQISGEPAVPPERDVRREFRQRDEMTCYKCGEVGHIGPRCPKGHLGFLSLARNVSKPE